MKFLVPNYSCLQIPWLRGYHSQIPVLSVLCPQLNLLNPPRKKFLGTPLAACRQFLLYCQNYCCVIRLVCLVTSLHLCSWTTILIGFVNGTCAIVCNVFVVWFCILSYAVIDLSQYKWITGQPMFVKMAFKERHSRSYLDLTERRTEWRESFCEEAWCGLLMTGWENVSFWRRIVLHGVGWLVSWLVGWLVSWLAGCLLRFVVSFVEWLWHWYKQHTRTLRIA